MITGNANRLMYRQTKEQNYIKYSPFTVKVGGGAIYNTETKSLIIYINSSRKNILKKKLSK